MRIKTTLFIKNEEQSGKYFDLFTDNMISASQEQKLMQTRKSF